MSEPEPKSLYIAGAYGRKAEFRNYKTHLEMNGIKVTSTWLSVEGVDIRTDEGLSPYGPAATCAEEDIDDIKRAHGFLFFSSKDHDVKGQGGRHTEFGIALAHGKEIFLVGRREHVFHSLVPDVRVYGAYHEFFDAVIKLVPR